MFRYLRRRSTLVSLVPLAVATLAAGCGRTETVVAVDTADTESFGTFGEEDTDTTDTTFSETSTDDVMGFCGDGFTDVDEECDFGPENGLPGSECTESCEFNFCGDFHLGPDEDCDFGFENGQDGSECTADCQFNFCGDFHLGPFEECDFGFQNGELGSECTGECLLNVCGDFHLGPDEECDLGFQNGQPGSECTDECQGNVCGDGHVGPFEECDFGDDNGNGAECKDDCQLNFCGDGYVGPGEGCDDGNDVDDDGCSNSCVLPSCGDGAQQLDEECDDGNDDNTDACTDACTVAACGDGFTQPGNDEECDDGNGVDTDLCTSLCEDAVCGDGITQPDNGEACDDGNDDNTDGCTSACQAPACGDGFVQGLEACDDGDDIDGNGCNNDCNFSGQLVWQRLVDAEGGGDAAHDVALDSQGNLLVSGRTFHSTPSNHTKMWLRKYDPDGETIWTRTNWGGVGFDYGYTVGVDADDNVIVGGRIQEAPADGAANAWLRKYDAAGNTIWTEVYSGLDGSTDRINGLAVAADGSIFTAGDSWSMGEAANAWVARYLPDGSQDWADFYVGPDGSQDRGFDVTLDLQGGPIVCGETWVMGEGENLLVRRYTAAGAESGTEITDFATSEDVGYSTALTADGGYVVSGTAWASGQGQNALLRKYGPGDQLLWTRTYNSNPDNSVEVWEGVDVGPNGQIVVVGYAYIGSDRDLFIRKYDADGNELWSIFEAGPGDGTDRGRSVVIGPDNSIYVVGDINMGATGGDIMVRKLTP